MVVKDPPAVTLLKRARCTLLSDRQIDAEIVRQLVGIMSGMSVADQIAFVNAQDANGVAALHLAIAYGLLSTCGKLLYHKADHKVVTAQGARPHDFALAAERLAGQRRDYRLYTRIMMCREYVRCGRKPPAPREATNTGARGLPKLTDDDDESKAEHTLAPEAIETTDHAQTRKRGGSNVSSLSHHDSMAKEPRLDKEAPKHDHLRPDASMSSLPARQHLPMSSSPGSALSNPWSPDTEPSNNPSRSSFTNYDTAYEVTFQPSPTPGSARSWYEPPRWLISDSLCSRNSRLRSIGSRPTRTCTLAARYLRTCSQIRKDG